MSLASLIRRMSDAGATPEAIAIAVEAIENTQADACAVARRQYERERKAAYRAAKNVPDNRGTFSGQDGDISGQNADPRARVVISNSPTENIIKTPLSEGQKAEPVSAQPEVKSKPKADRGHRLPADWEPGPAGEAYAAEKFGPGWPAEFEKFKNHWAAASGPGAVKRCWAAGWRNWIIRAAEYRQKTGPPRQRRQTFADFILEDFHERDRNHGTHADTTSADDAAGFRPPGLPAEPATAGATGHVIDLRPSRTGWR